MPKSEKKVAEEMLAKGYGYVAFFPEQGYPPMCFKTLSEATEFHREKVPEIRPRIQSIKDFLAGKTLAEPAGNIIVEQRKLGPGKFETSGTLGEWLYDVSGSGGADEEIGSVDELGWFGLFLFPKGVEVHTKEGEVWRFRGAILGEDQYGFIESDTFDTIKEARAAWKRIKDEYHEFDAAQEGEV